MLKRASHTFALILFLTPGPALAVGNFAPISATNVGYAAATALSGGTTSEPIDMGATTGVEAMSRITLLMTVVWGTSVLLNLTGQYSYDGTNYFDITRCTSAVIHNCGPRTWQWEPADGTTPSLDYTTNAPWLQFTFDDPGAGSGTIIVSAVRGS